MNEQANEDYLFEFFFCQACSTLHSVAELVCQFDKIDCAVTEADELVIVHEKFFLLLLERGLGLPTKGNKLR